MAEAQKGKNIFQQAIDSVSTRDEKAAIEAALKRAEELEKQAALADQKSAQAAAKQVEAEQRTTLLTKKLAEAEAKAVQLQADLTKTKTDLAAVQMRLAETEKKLSTTDHELQKLVAANFSRQAAAAAEAAAQSKIIAEHQLTADEALSHLSLKYYGSATEPYWRVIYEANKETIGPNPNRVRPGMVIKIPVLPKELEKK